MNDHEAQRIAAAMHAARPDWPTSSVLTLIRKNLIDRPRRDVFVAFAWVASEPASHTPARVLEGGPWWRAAGIEGVATTREVLTPDQRCGICAKNRRACEAAPRFADDDHTFEPDFKHRLGSAVDELRDIKAKATAAPDKESTDA